VSRRPRRAPAGSPRAPGRRGPASVGTSMARSSVTKRARSRPRPLDALLVGLAGEIAGTVPSSQEVRAKRSVYPRAGSPMAMISGTATATCSATTGSQRASFSMLAPPPVAAAVAPPSRPRAGTVRSTIPTGVRAGARSRRTEGRRRPGGDGRVRRRPVSRLRGAAALAHPHGSWVHPPLGRSEGAAVAVLPEQR
jgi:hypothetical protein